MWKFVVTAILFIMRNGGNRKKGNIKFDPLEKVGVVNFVKK